MKRFFTVLVILLPLAVTAAQAGGISPSGSDLQARWDALAVKGLPAHYTVPTASFQEKWEASFVVAHSAPDSPGKGVKKDKGPSDDLDLREVDWDKVKAGNKVKNGDGKNGDNGDKNGDGEDGEDEKDEKAEKDENDEGGGGWDRLWDAPRLG